MMTGIGGERRTLQPNGRSLEPEMYVSPRSLAIAAGAAALVTVVAYAAGHQRGKGREGRLNLARYRWKNRVVLVFAPHAEDPAFQEQMGQFAGEIDGVRDRDIVVLPILADGRVGTASRRDAGMLARAHAVPKGAFRVVLIGKDGTTKRTDDRPVAVERLFDLIDGMPMRQQETGRRRQPTRASLT
ncbi:MAG: DUF4174 domain-containing protein [Fimbriimonas sp.]